jgi:hypothetical protein
MKKNQNEGARRKKKRPAFYFSQVSGIAPRPAYAKKNILLLCKDDAARKGRPPLFNKKKNYERVART